MNEQMDNPKETAVMVIIGILLVCLIFAWGHGGVDDPCDGPDAETFTICK